MKLSHLPSGCFWAAGYSAMAFCTCCHYKFKRSRSQNGFACWQLIRSKTFSERLEVKWLVFGKYLDWKILWLDILWPTCDRNLSRFANHIYIDILIVCGRCRFPETIPDIFGPGLFPFHEFWISRYGKCSISRYPISHRNTLFKNICLKERSK